MTIDWWTLGFQTVNVAILIWLLGRFFWQPVAAMIEARKSATQALTDQASAEQASAKAALAEVAQTRAGFAQEREAILVAAHKAADAAHDARLAQTETEVAALKATAQAHNARDKQAQEAAWADRSSDLAVGIARRLAARLRGAVVEGCFLDWLVAELGTLPAAVRAAAGASAVTLQATTANALDAAARDAIVTSIGRALGGTPRIDFQTDPALIAGIELRGDHLVVNSSWRADLGVIRAGLTP